MSETERANPITGDWLTPGRFAVLLGVLVFAAYPQVFLGLQTFVYRDFGSFGYPIAYHLRESFWRGEIPLWNPLSNCGAPFLAQWGVQALYPPSLFYLVFPLVWALPVFCLLHLYLGGLGMFFLARRWTGDGLGAAFAGLIFAFNGLMLNSLMWPSTISGLGWMPWVVLLTERAWREGGKWMVIAVLAGALQMLGGAVEVILMTWVLLGVICLTDLFYGKQSRWQTLLRAGLVVVVVTGLSAAQLLPFLDFLSHSNRQENFNATDWPMPVTGWVNFLAPLFHTRSVFQGVFLQENQNWTSSYYVGVLTVALAAWAVWRVRGTRTRLLVVMTLFCLVLAMGDATPVYSWLRHHVSVIGLIRYPVKFVILPVLALPLLAAFALAEWQKRVARQQPGFDRLWWWICGTTIVLLLGMAWLSYVPRQPGDDDPAVIVLNTLMRLAFFLVLVAGLVWLAKTTTVRRSGLVVLAVLVSGWLDVSHHAPQPFTVNPLIYGPNLPRSLPQPFFGVSRAMLSHEGAYELIQAFHPDAHKDYLTRRYTLVNNCNLLDDIAKVDGFFPLEVREHTRISGLFYAGDAPDPAPAPLLDFLGVSQMTTPGKIYEWTRRTKFMPLITGGQQPVFADESTTLKMLAKNDFNPRAEVYLPTSAASSVTVTNMAHVSISPPRYSAQCIEIDAVTADAPALLVVAQTYYHPWQAYVDGHLEPLLLANEAFQALEIPAGQHKVVFIYQDRAFYAGLILSGLALVICLVPLFYRRRSRKSY
jgi:hypothetical protein